MGQYCPKCLSNDITLPTSSIVHIVINGMRTNLNYILFGSDKSGQVHAKEGAKADHILFKSGQGKEAFKKELTDKIESFFTYYVSQPNHSSIKTIKIFSNDYECDNQCRLKGVNISVLDHLISPQSLMGILNNLAKKYSIKLEVTVEDID